MQSQTPDFILIVDDNPANLAVLTRTLKGAGCAVRVAVDGESALQQAEEEPPSLILLDIMMSGIDGFETCRRLKENPITQAVPVIFMTALGESEDKVHGLSLGAIDYVTKPFNESEVLARVRTHLKLQNLLHTLQDQNQRLKQEIEQRQAAEQKLQRLNDEMRRTQIRLVQQEKLSAVGELVTGIAHEINNPVGCIAGNVEFIQEYAEQLLEHIALYQQHFPERGSAIEEHAGHIELDYIAEDLPAVVRSMQTSSDRITAISNSLRLFTRRSRYQNQKRDFDIHELIDSTLLILRHRLKVQKNRAVIEVNRNYGDLPEIPCFPSQINQALMNVLSTVIDTFDERFTVPEDAVISPSIDTFEEHTPLQIRISTEVEMETETTWAVLHVQSNAGETLRGNQPYPFAYAPSSNPAFLYTEMDLLIAHQIVVDTHKGEFNSNSTANTEITIKLPTH